MSSSLARAVARGGSGMAVAGKFKLGSGGGARREWHGGGRRVRARLGRRHAEGVARRWPASSSSARAAAHGGSGTAVAGEFELGRGWLRGEGATRRWREGGSTLQTKSLKEEDARESGGRFTEATKMPIPRRRQNGALGKIDSVQSALGIGSFGSTRGLFSMEAAYNLSQTRP
jgi:hypothetical protein